MVTHTGFYPALIKKSLTRDEDTRCTKRVSLFISSRHTQSRYTKLFSEVLRKQPSSSQEARDDKDYTSHHEAEKKHQTRDVESYTETSTIKDNKNNNKDWGTQSYSSSDEVQEILKKQNTSQDKNKSSSSSQSKENDEAKDKTETTHIDKEMLQYIWDLLPQLPTQLQKNIRSLGQEGLSNALKADTNMQKDDTSPLQHIMQYLQKTAEDGPAYENVFSNINEAIGLSSLPQTSEEAGGQKVMPARSPLAASYDKEALIPEQSVATLSDISMTRSSTVSLKELLPQDGEVSNVSVDSASYLNMAHDASHENSTVRAEAAVEQGVSKEVDDRNGQDRFANKNSFASLDISRVPSLDEKNVDTSFSGGQNSDHMGQDDGQQQGESFLEKDNKRLLSTSPQSADDSLFSFHSMMNEKIDSYNQSVFVSDGMNVAEQHARYAPSEIENLSPLIAKKLLTDTTDKLNMTIKTSDETSVKVKLERHSDGEAIVSLQGDDEATTELLKKSHHRLLDQLHSAGMDASRIKIEVLPADLHDSSSDMSQDVLDNASQHGQFGQEQNRAQDDRRSGQNTSSGIMASFQDDAAAHIELEKVESRLISLPVAASGGLNISV